MENWKAISLSTTPTVEYLVVAGAGGGGGNIGGGALRNLGAAAGGGFKGDAIDGDAVGLGQTAHRLQLRVHRVDWGLFAQKRQPSGVLG